MLLFLVYFTKEGEDGQDDDELFDNINQSIQDSDDEKEEGNETRIYKIFIQAGKSLDFKLLFSP